jgi:hypothetical protein
MADIRARTHLFSTSKDGAKRLTNEKDYNSGNHSKIKLQAIAEARVRAVSLDCLFALI